MAGYNRIIIVGNLTRDPDYKQLASGQAVCRLSLATNRQFKNRQTGAMVQEVCYIDVDVWGPQAESSRQYLQKGRSVLIEGRLKYDTWEAEGQKRGKHSIVADRVVFLAAGASDQAAESEEAGDVAAVAGARLAQPTQSSTVSADLEKELFDQIDRLKNKSVAKNNKKPAAAVASDDIEFKDQLPFEEELPF